MRLGVLALLLAAWATACAAPTATPVALDAYSITQQFVGQALKAPATARFPYSGDPAVHIQNVEGAVWRVTGYVDSQNSFGALLRTNYVATVQWMGGQQWKLVDLKFPDAP